MTAMLKEKIGACLFARPFPVQVGCYAGYRGEETPRRFQLGSRSVVVSEVLDRWLAPDHRYFKLRGDDGGLYILRHDGASMEWEVVLFAAGPETGSAGIEAAKPHHLQRSLP